ncbi:protein SRC2 homolog [Impatiens glandulifera]|uniref:protein SRC2 homolog n=1 Tax=Impatiens glandulifera TaxID=253017 RepID=UPI001FB0AE3E|nr:protein SRC2 homolog [Impatiens glandulifera]
MATSRPPPPPLKLYDLEITIVSAKHLKNVNWRNGDLKPYAIFWLDPDRRLATKSDDSGSIHPVWNERFILPLNLPLHDSILTSEIFHSKPSEVSKPLVGTLRIELRDLQDLDDPTRLRTFELRRPSGRPHGKIRLKLAVQERPSPPDYRIPQQSNYYYSTAPPPPPPPRPLPPPTRDYRGYSPPPPHPSHGNPYGSYSDPYSSYYPGYYSQQPPHPPPPARPFFDRQSSYGGPSAPVDYAPYDQNTRSSSGKMGFGSGLAVGAAAGALGGLALDEGLKYEDEKIAAENDLASRADYSNDYRRDY